MIIYKLLSAIKYIVNEYIMQIGYCNDVLKTNYFSLFNNDNLIGIICKSTSPNPTVICPKRFILPGNIYLRSKLPGHYFGVSYIYVKKKSRHSPTSTFIASCYSPGRYFNTLYEAYITAHVTNNMQQLILIQNGNIGQ